MGTKCFMLTETDQAFVWLSISTAWEVKCTAAANPYKGTSGHSARVRIEDLTIPILTKGYYSALAKDNYESDSRWPTKCDYCEYVFQSDAERGVDWMRQYTDGRTFGILPGHIPLGVPAFGAGAMYYAGWRNEDGKHSCPFWDNCTSPHLMVQTPGGGWDIDSRASNCTRPNDKTHRCWIRHGEPPNLTIDKNGITCAAGAGSIMSGGYHGFLRNGEFT